MRRDVRQSDTQAIILIFQMAKVASRSWSAVISDAFPDALTSHFHAISRQRVDKIERLIAEQPPVQTIKHLTLARLGRPEENIVGFIEDGRWTGPPATIIAGVRDPVARAISAVGFLCNRLGYVPYPVTPRDGGVPENILALFHRAVDVARRGDDGSDTFITLLAGIIGDFDKWFDEELNAGFDLDSRSVPFDRGARALVLKGRNQALVYRMEDLKEKSTREPLLNAAGGLLGRTLPNFPAPNIVHERRYYALYSKVTSALRLTAQDLDWFYDNETMTHFYSEAEIDGFRRRWTA